MFKVSNKDSSVSIVNLEQVNAGWVPTLSFLKTFVQLHSLKLCSCNVYRFTCIHRIISIWLPIICIK